MVDPKDDYGAGTADAPLTASPGRRSDPPYGWGPGDPPTPTSDLAGLGLSVRHQRALERAGIWTIDELCRRSHRTVLAVRGIHRAGLRAIVNSLGDRDRCLNEPVVLGLDLDEESTDGD